MVDIYFPSVRRVSAELQHAGTTTYLLLRVDHSHILRVTADTRHDLSGLAADFRKVAKLLESEVLAGVAAQ